MIRTSLLNAGKSISADNSATKTLSKDGSSPTNMAIKIIEFGSLIYGVLSPIVSRFTTTITEETTPEAVVDKSLYFNFEFFTGSGNFTEFSST